MYGVWLPSHGWVRGKENKCFADYNKEVAVELAQRLGNHAQVYFIDQSLIDLESMLLMAERSKLNLFQRIHKVLKVSKNGNHSQAIQER